MKQTLKQIWDLERIFPGGSDSQEFQVFLGQLEEEIDSLQKDISQTRVPSTVEESMKLVPMVQAIQDVQSRVYEAIAFTECLTAQDAKDEKANLLYSRAVQQYTAFSSLLIQLDRLLLQIPTDIWESFLEFAEIRAIAFPLHERRVAALEKLPPEQEMLANDLSTDGYHAWSSLYSKVVSNIVIPYEKEGKREELSVGQADNLLAHKDRAVRSQIFSEWEKAWSNAAELCAHALNHLGGYRLELYRHRGWDFVLKEPLELNRMAEETLHTMWDVISQNKELLVRYLQRKAEMLGLEKLAWYDVDAPLGKVTRKVEYEDAATTIVDEFRRFSPQMAEFAKQALENRWIEAEDRPGKRPGGFCTSFPLSKESRIFMTYSGTMENVSTLAHELGHAYHQYVMDDLPPLTQNYAMNVAETASTFAEMLVADSAVRNAPDDQEKMVLLDQKAQSSVAYLMNIHARFLFETSFYERRKQGPVSVEELNQLMIAAQKEAYVDALSDYHPHFWASKLHFYATEVPFYNFPYTFGYLFSYGIYARSLEEGAGFEQKYVALLRDTGRMRVEDLAKKHLDVDLRQPGFWQSAVDLALADIQEFLRLTEK